MAMTRKQTTAILLGIAALTLAGAFAVRTGDAKAQPVSPWGVRDHLFAAWIPPGEYTAIVVCSSADTRDWAISLRSRDGIFPFVVGPHRNVIIPFETPWKVTPDSEARLLSEHIPFADISARNQLNEQAYPLYLSAWGITTSGPVPFLYREVK